MSICISADFDIRKDGTKCTVPYCKFTIGECQFTEDEAYEICPIYIQYGHEESK